MDRTLAFGQPLPAGKVNGFTILEVMIALAILSIALTGIYRLHGQTMMISAHARFYNLAPMLAQAKLAEIEHQSFKELTPASGDFDETYPGYTGYKWSSQFEEVSTELLTEKYYHLTRIDINISQNEEKRYHLRTFRFFVE